MSMVNGIKFAFVDLKATQIALDPAMFSANKRWSYKANDEL
jgi:hypothetical protein